MDEKRRELYVEGERDRIFLNWLLGDGKDPNAVVIEIGAVDIQEGQGGERGRLLTFAAWIADRLARVRFMADADWDRLLDRQLPPNVWITDLRDLEGYVLREDCLEKVLKLGAVTERLSASAVLTEVQRECRRLGLLRVLSERDSLKLPFQRTDLWKFVAVDIPTITVNLRKYLRALLQNSGTSLRLQPQLEAHVTTLAEQYAGIADAELVHGKDAFCLVERVLFEFGIKRGEGRRILWTSFEKGFVKRDSTLARIVEYLG